MAAKEEKGKRRGRRRGDGMRRRTRTWRNRRARIRRQRMIKKGGEVTDILEQSSGQQGSGPEGMATSVLGGLFPEKVSDLDLWPGGGGGGGHAQATTTLTVNHHEKIC